MISEIAQAEPSEGSLMTLFLSELTALTRRYRMGINGTPELYAMEPDDLLFSWTCNDQGRLVLA